MFSAQCAVMVKRKSMKGIESYKIFSTLMIKEADKV